MRGIYIQNRDHHGHHNEEPHLNGNEQAFHKGLQTI
jgi:hypothetical protein